MWCALCQNRRVFSVTQRELSFEGGLCSRALSFLPIGCPAELGQMIGLEGIERQGEKGQGGGCLGERHSQPDTI